MSTPVAATVFVGAQSSLGASGNLSTVPFQCVSHRYMVSTAQFQAQQQQFSECRGYTYYSPLSLDNMPSPSNTAYALSTPPFSSPIQQLKNYFFPTAISTSIQQDQSKTSSQKGDSEAISNRQEVLAAALPQQPAISATSPPTQSSQLMTYPCWHPGWPYLPVTTQDLSNSCHICGKIYARLSTLRSHLKSHTGEKPYQCSICQKSFTQAANLTAHLRIHSGEKPFKCSVCHRGFSQSSSVTTHMRTHSGDRPYKCNVCSKGFADSSTLTKHYRTHTGEKPYQCKICEARFSQSGNLNRHMRTHRQHFINIEMAAITTGEDILA